MADIKDTLTEIKDIINTLKTQADNNGTWANTTDKDAIEKRIKHLEDKSNARHTNLTADLKQDLKTLENVDAMIGKNAIDWANEKSVLEKAKKDAETERDAKNTIIADKEKELKEQKEKVGDKLTSDLITKLESVANSTPADQTTKLTEIKTIIDELKTKGTKVDLTDITAKVDALTAKAEEIKSAQGKGGDSPAGTNYWSIGACCGAIVAVLLGVYSAFIKPAMGNNGRYSEKEES